MSTYKVDTVTMTLTDDGETYAIADAATGYTTNGYDLEGAVELAIELAVTEEDVNEWHVGNITMHMRDIINDVQAIIPDAVIQIWGSGENEPLSVNLA